MKIIVDELPKSPSDCLYSTFIKAGIGFNRVTTKCKISASNCNDVKDCPYIMQLEDKEDE